MGWSMFWKYDDAGGNGVGLEGGEEVIVNRGGRRG